MASRADSQNTTTTEPPEHTLRPAAELEEHTRQVEYLSRAVRILAWDLSEKQGQDFYGDAFIGMANAFDDLAVKFDKTAERLFPSRAVDPGVTLAGQTAQTVLSEADLRRLKSSANKLIEAGALVRIITHHIHPNELSTNTTDPGAGSDRETLMGTVGDLVEYAAMAVIGVYDKDGAGKHLDELEARSGGEPS
jgi:hypothetical protein